MKITGKAKTFSTQQSIFFSFKVDPFMTVLSKNVLSCSFDLVFPLYWFPITKVLISQCYYSCYIQLTFVPTLHLHYKMRLIQYANT
jgi:hypothetical protein